MLCFGVRRTSRQVAVIAASAVNYLTFCELFPEVPNPVPAFIPANPGQSDRLALPSGTWSWQSFLTPEF